MRGFREVLIALVCAAGCGGGTSTLVEAVCDDGGDDDGDGATDCADPDCENDQACAAPSFDVTDPEDLPGPDGDPSLDIAGVNVSVDDTTVTCEVFFHGTWPPSNSLYSWFVECAYS